MAVQFDGTGKFFDALRAAVAAVWPDANVHGTFEAEHAEMIPWDRLNIPFSAIVIFEAQESEEWSAIGAHTYEVPVQLYYTADIKSDSSPIRAKLEAMRDYLYADNLTFGQVMGIPALNWGDNLAPNELFASKNYTQRSGMVEFTAIVGEIVTVG